MLFLCASMVSFMVMLVYSKYLYICYLLLHFKHHCITAISCFAHLCTSSTVMKACLFGKMLKVLLHLSTVWLCVVLWTLDSNLNSKHFPRGQRKAKSNRDVILPEIITFLLLSLYISTFWESRRIWVFPCMLFFFLNSRIIYNNIWITLNPHLSS